MELYLDHYHEGLEYYHYCANYAGYRGMWNPNFDYEAAIEEHWIPFYGKDAGPELREFHKLLNECFMKFHLPQDDLNPLYPVSYLDKMEAHLKKAQKVVEPGTIEARRVAFYLTPWKDAIAAQPTHLQPPDLWGSSASSFRKSHHRRENGGAVLERCKNCSHD